MEFLWPDSVWLYLGSSGRAVRAAASIAQYMAVGPKLLHIDYCFSFPLFPFLAPSLPPFIFASPSNSFRPRFLTCVSEEVLYSCLNFLPSKRGFCISKMQLCPLTLTGSPTLFSDWYIQLWLLISSCLHSQGFLCSSRHPTC